MACLDVWRTTHAPGRAAIRTHGSADAEHEICKASGFANAESLTHEEQEAVDDKQGSSPAVSDLCCCIDAYHLISAHVPEASAGSTGFSCLTCHRVWRLWAPQSCT